MEERLCFGTFINVLAQCKGARVKKGRLTNTIIQTIDPKSQYVVEKETTGKSADKDNSTYRALNHLYKCDGDFSPQYSSVMELAPKADRELVIQRFRKNVIPLIDGDKSAQAVLALYAIIKNDATLKADGGVNVKKLQTCIGNKTIEDFFGDTNYELAEVLASIFLYTVTAVKNIEGRKWLQEIAQYGKYEDFFAEYVNNVSVGAPNIDHADRTKGQIVWVRDQFLAAIQRFDIMEIINRQPPILNRTDSTKFEIFCDQIRNLTPGNSSPDSLEKFIEIFHDNLLCQALALDATLNNRFGFDNEAAFVNMEETDADSEEFIKKLKALGVPSLTDELLEEAEEPLELLKITAPEWGKFKYKMNFLFEKIRSWGDKTAKK